MTIISYACFFFYSSSDDDEVSRRTTRTSNTHHTKAKYSTGSCTSYFTKGDFRETGKSDLKTRLEIETDEHEVSIGKNRHSSILMLEDDGLNPEPETESTPMPAMIESETTAPFGDKIGHFQETVAGNNDRKELMQNNWIGPQLVTENTDLSRFSQAGMEQTPLPPQNFETHSVPCRNSVELEVPWTAHKLKPDQSMPQFVQPSRNRDYGYHSAVSYI